MPLLAGDAAKTDLVSLAQKERMGSEGLRQPSVTLWSPVFLLECIGWVGLRSMKLRMLSWSPEMPGPKMCSGDRGGGRCETQ